MLTADKVKTIHTDLTKALQEVAKKHGLVLSPTHIRYNASTFKLTAEFGDKAATGGTDPKLLNNMKRHGWKFGLSVTDIGSTFDHPQLGKTTLNGMSGTQKAAITGGGKQYVMRASDVARYLGKKSNLSHDFGA